MRQVQPAEGQSSGGRIAHARRGAWSPEVARDVAAALEMISNGRPLPAVLAALARAVERHEAGVLASVLLTTQDGRSLIHGAAPSLPESYTRAIDGAEIGPEAGTCGTAAFNGTRVWSHDIGTDPRW